MILKNQITTNKNFGIVFFIVFFIISFWPLLNNENIRVWSIILSGIFLILGLLNSTILTPLNKVWAKFGILLGSVMSPIILSIIFFAVVTPTSLIMKMFGKNLLGLKKDNKKSYWVERSSIKSKMKNQF
jgi:predicted membrane protein